MGCITITNNYIYANKIMEQDKKFILDDLNYFIQKKIKIKYNKNNNLFQLYCVTSNKLIDCLICKKTNFIFKNNNQIYKNFIDCGILNDVEIICECHSIKNLVTSKILMYYIINLKINNDIYKIILDKN